MNGIHEKETSRKWPVAKIGKIAGHLNLIEDSTEELLRRTTAHVVGLESGVLDLDREHLSQLSSLSDRVLGVGSGLARASTQGAIALALKAGEPEDVVVDAKYTARRFGRKPDWVYQHAGDILAPARLDLPGVKFSRAGVEKLLAERGNHASR